MLRFSVRFREVIYGKLQETFVNDNFMNTFHFESYPDFTFDYIKKKNTEKRRR